MPIPVSCPVPGNMPRMILAIRPNGKSDLAIKYLISGLECADIPCQHPGSAGSASMVTQVTFPILPTL